MFYVMSIITAKTLMKYSYTSIKQLVYVNLVVIWSPQELTQHTLTHESITYVFGASSRDVTTIKKVIKIFSLTCKWSLLLYSVASI